MAWLLLTRPEDGSISINSEHVALVYPAKEHAGSTLLLVDGRHFIQAVESYAWVMEQIKQKEE